MTGNDELAICIRFLKNITGKEKNGIDESLTILENEAATKGLDNSHLQIIADVVTRTSLRGGIRIRLIKCLIPRKKISKNIVEAIIKFYLTNYMDLPVMISTIILQWLAGLWEYQLVHRQTINVYYDCFFYIMLKKERLESPIARLLYLLSKPEDVTRRQVSRLLRLQSHYSKPQKHISALLSLFKSYKPELVPEKIPSLNIESVWKPLPEVLRLGFEDAQTRGSASESQQREFFNWNTVKSIGGKKTEPLIPSIRYFQMGSTIYKEKDMKSLFDLNNIDDIGKYHFDIELPSNAASLLANNAGYHFLTYASYEYQNRFSHNLYNTLRRAFIIEGNKFSPSQKGELLDMTVEFCRYMKQGIPVVIRFLMEYLPLESGEYRDKILSLLEWSTFISAVELQDMAIYIETMFLESSLEERCAIIKTLKQLTTNLFVNQRFGREITLQPSPFLGQIPSSELSDVLPVLLKIVDHIIEKGLHIHNNNTIFINESLNFYEQIHKLAIRCDPPILIIAPSVVIYNGFITKSLATLSRVCALLLSYRDTNNNLKTLNLHANYEAEVRALRTYARALGNALWNDKVFSEDYYNSEFIATLTDKMIEHLPSNRNKLLNITNHLAILPHKCTLIDTGLVIVSKNDAMTLADHYYPIVNEFIKSLEEYDSEKE
ncbi:hypothetical protein PV328_005975 [Microctonus aethiopoides]|uniref:Centromere protein I n=1 Tax=Microctonus aethiopoides TaxID=144406 RepID=A0AA39FNI0_9HYME|nr:hypothetical protein PV328_005975 [Microctonus aethiopoides]